MDTKGSQTEGLKHSFTPLGIWAFSIGTSIGWGSFIVTCNTYLQKSGILGTVFGLLIGMAVILVITWNLQYMIVNAPDAGGIYGFERLVSGKDLGFLAAWFVLMTYMAILWANITSVPLFARFFLGDTFQFGFRYQLFGYEVWFGEALLSILAVLIIGLLCSKSSRIPNYIMIIAASVFAIGFTVCSVIAFIRHNSSFNYSPLYAPSSNAFAEILRIAVISPWAFIGFENVSHFSEEYTFPKNKIRRILILSVIVTTALYILVSLLSISAYPPEYRSWMEYIKDMGNLSGIKAVPAFYAADRYLGETGVFILMLSLFGVILTSLIGNMMALSRLLYAAGREGEAPKLLATVSSRGVPANAIYAIMAVSVLIPFLGRTAIGWIVDVTTLGATMIYGLISYAVFKHAKGEGRNTERNTGIAGIFLMVCFLLLLLIPGLLPFHAMETESYVLFIAWALVGLFYYRTLIRRDRSRDYGQRILVWIILLVMILFASMMWVSRATEKAATEAVHRIYEYHQTHSEHDTAAGAAEEREAYLQAQADHVSSTNTLYTVVSLAFLIISITVMVNNYKDTKEVGERIAYSRLRALTGDYLCIYIVVPETGRYREYSTSSGFMSLELPEEGQDFFGDSRDEIGKAIHPEDLERFLALFDRDSILAEIERSGIFTITYRLMIGEKPTYVRLKAAMVEEKEGQRLIVGVNDIDAQIRQEEEYSKRLAQAQSKANVDALTGVKSKHAFLEAEDRLNLRIAEHTSPDFAIVILDVNDLKKVNDNEGHQAGDLYLQAACRIVCKIFKQSPVFRVGGDEFAVITQGDDYDSIKDRIAQMREHNEEALQTGGIVIACGMARYDNDSDVGSVYERADQLMYENKDFLKSKKTEG